MKDLEFLSRSLIAHRGYHNNKKGIPENSVLAFKKAIDNNYLIELDVRLTKDKKLVVFHDDNLKRVCGVNKKVKDLTYKELLKYNLFDTTLKVPLFSDVIKLVNGRVPILIETKYHNRYGVLEKILINELSNYRGLYAIQSFYPMSLLWLKINTKDIDTNGMIVYNDTRTAKCIFTAQSKNRKNIADVECQGREVYQ